MIDARVAPLRSNTSSLSEPCRTPNAVAVAPANTPNPGNLA
jgi:hypothetical protein